MKNIVIFLILTVLCYACLPTEKFYSIWIKNDSDQKIFFIAGEAYPDTSLPAVNTYLTPIDARSRESLDNNHPWKDSFTEYFPKDTLLIFFFNADTINKYDWEIIRSYYKVAEKRAYSKGELENANWTITYP